MQETKELFETIMTWAREAQYNLSNYPELVEKDCKIKGFFISNDNT